MYAFIRSSRVTANTSIEKLTVGDKVYLDNKVADGFYDALTSVKSIEESELVTNPAIAEHFSNYDLIRKMRKDNTRLKPISLAVAASLLSRSNHLPTHRPAHNNN